jgi:hypothetical protein
MSYRSGASFSSSSIVRTPAMPLPTSTRGAQAFVLGFEQHIDHAVVHMNSRRGRRFGLANGSPSVPRSSRPRSLRAAGCRASGR